MFPTLFGIILKMHVVHSSLGTRVFSCTLISAKESDGWEDPAWHRFMTR